MLAGLLLHHYTVVLVPLRHSVTERSGQDIVYRSRQWHSCSLARRLPQVRRRHGVTADSKLAIQVAEADMYFATIDDKVAVKLGPRYDMGELVPKGEDGWELAVSGKDFAVWERKQ